MPYVNVVMTTRTIPRRVLLPPVPHTGTATAAAAAAAAAVFNHYHELPKITFWLWGLPR